MSTTCNGSNYDGALDYGTWGRVALVFETTGSGQQMLSKYLDGVFVDSQVVDADVNDGSRWSIDADTGFLLLTDNDGETSDVYLNAMHFTTEVLSAAQIAEMGGVDVDGPAASSADPEAFQLSFDGAVDALDYGDATVEAVNMGGGETSYIVKGSIFGNPNGEGEAALYQQSNGDEEIIVWQDGADWADYTFDSVIEPADNDMVGAVFYWQDAQNHYRLTMDQQNDLRTLTRVAGGVETVLATETASYRHFAKQDLRIAVIDGKITVTLDDELLFDGPVTDDAPLTGGSVGFVTAGMDRVEFDNITVNAITLSARAMTTELQGRWATDLDGDGLAQFQMTAAASLSAAGITLYEWLVDGDVLATGETAALDLGAGETTVTLRVTEADGLTAEDTFTVTAAAQAAILAQDDFADILTGWTIVDEGTLNGPSDWSVENGVLVQASDIPSPQQGTGSNAYSVGGDGPYILRDGTYALWDDAAAEEWTDYAVEATLTPNDDDGIGLLFRYTDDENYYKLEADAETGLVMLIRHLEGRETILARGWHEYTEGEAQRWRIEVDGGEFRAFIDGKAVFGSPVQDRTLEAGTVGLYAWGSENLQFDDILVTMLDTPAATTASGYQLAEFDTSGVAIDVADLSSRLAADHFVFGAPDGLL